MKTAQSGYILVHVLIVVACLVALMAMFAANQHAVLQATQDRLRQRRAEAAVQAAISQALAVLQTSNSSVVLQTDTWYQQGDNGNQEFKLSGSTYRMQLIDAASLININLATLAQLQQLPITQEQIDSLLDWREPGTTPRPDGGKNEYYNNLPTPYNARLGSLVTLNELMLIRGWTGQTLYTTQNNVSSPVALPTDPQGNTLPLISMLTVDSGSPNTQASGAARVNLGLRVIPAAALARLRLPVAVSTLITQRAPFTSFTQLLALPGITPIVAAQLLNSVTFTGGTRVQGKINVNTASLSVLETIPNVTTSIANSIVTQQTTGFSTLGALANLPGLTTRVLGPVADACAIGSDTWILRAYGQCNGIGMAIEAVITLTNGAPQIQTWERLNTSGIPSWWGWAAQPTETVDMEVQQ